MTKKDDDARTGATVKRAVIDAPRESDKTFTLVVVEGPDKDRAVTVDGSQASPVLIGKSESCEMRLSDPEVSRRHAAVEPIRLRLLIRDLGSTNGTTVDGVAIVEAYLRGGEIVRIGASAIRVDREIGRAPATRAPFATSFGRVLGASPEMRRIYPFCERLAASDVPLIVEGETGTGKEVLAEALHDAGPRASGPFVVFDCTAVPPNLVEAELFGHERGAFTGAVASRKGVFEQADGGTLLIDEIGDLALSLQPKLLRALERSEVRRVGGDKWIRANVRVIAATRRDLDREVQEDRFRDDLFHRIAVTRIELPPLRRRRGDVRLLAAHFARELGSDDSWMTPDLLRQWDEYAWPGNVRELRNAVARRVALGDLAHEDATHADSGRNTSAVAGADALEEILGLDLPLVKARHRLVEEFERRYVERLLAQHGGSIARAAAASGVARRHFQRLRARGRR